MSSIYNDIDDGLGRYNGAEEASVENEVKPAGAGDELSTSA